MTPRHTMHLIEIRWAQGPASRHLVDEIDLEGLTWELWVSNHFLAAGRPHWARLGDLVFHTQTVQSIELIETIEQEG